MLGEWSAKGRRKKDKNRYKIGCKYFELTYIIGFSWLFRPGYQRQTYMWW